MAELGGGGVVYSSFGTSDDSQICSADGGNIIVFGSGRP